MVDVRVGYDAGVPIAEDVSRYASLIGDGLNLFERIADAFRSDPPARARRMRRRAARLEHRSRSAAVRSLHASGSRRARLFDRSSDLHKKAVALWDEAQAVDAVDVELAARLDKAASGVS